MRKLLSLIVALVLVLGMAGVPAMAEDVTITLMHNKVEIDSAIQAFAKLYSDTHEGVTVKIETIGGGADYAGALKAKIQADQMPEIFVIEGIGGYNIWKDYCSDLSNEPWVSDTDVAFKDGDKVVGFPVAIEGFGLGYNKDILDKAGIDPATLTTFSKVKEAFETLEAKKAELGLDAVVSMGASVSGGLWWVTGHHNFSVYLGGGLDANDASVSEAFMAGKVDEDRLNDYANYVKLLFDYADQNILTNGNYDAQVAAFAQGKTAFIHQGNWIDPNMKQLEVSFPMGYAPHAFTDKQEITGLFLFAPSFYCVNSKVDDAHAQAAKDFLTYMATTPEGADYMVNQAGMVPAYKSVSLLPAGDFSKALVEANAKGGNYAVRFTDMPDGFGLGTLAPIFDLFAQDTSGDNLELFKQDIANAATTLAK